MTLGVEIFKQRKIFSNFFFKCALLIFLTTMSGFTLRSLDIGLAEEDIFFRFIYGVTANPSSFDPLGANDKTSGDIILNIHDGLFAYDYLAENGIGIEPRLARNMGKWDESNHILTIPLRKDVLWHDYTEFTAEDVVWNFNRINNLSISGLNKHSSLWFNSQGQTIIEKVVASGEYEVKIYCRSYPNIVHNLLAYWGASMIKPFTTGMEEILGLDDMDQVIGCGPFLLEGYTAGETTTLTRHFDYYQGIANHEKIEFQIFQDEDAVTTALLNHKIHLAGNINPSNWENAKNDEKITVELLKRNQVYFYQMNVQNTLWEVRKAFQFAFNYINTINLAVTLPVHKSPIPDDITGYNSELSGLPIYDLNIAREFLFNSDDLNIQLNLILHGLTRQSSDEDWIAAAESDHPIYTARFTHYGTSFYQFLADDVKFIGVKLLDHNVGGWSAYLNWIEIPENSETIQFVFGGISHDFPEPVSYLAPLFTTNGISNRNGLKDAAIDGNIEKLYSLSENEKQEIVDQVVTQVIIEHSAAMYLCSSADIIAWNHDENFGIKEGAEVLLNSRGDKYFYPLYLVDGDPLNEFSGNILGIVSLIIGAILIIILIPKMNNCLITAYYNRKLKKTKK